jgi:hypothetical protein
LKPFGLLSIDVCDVSSLLDLRNTVRKGRIPRRRRKQHTAVVSIEPIDFFSFLVRLFLPSLLVLAIVVSLFLARRKKKNIISETSMPLSISLAE